MLYGLYHSAMGVQAQSARLDVLANNLANANTGAFKRDLALFQANRPFDVENGVGSLPPGNQNALSGGVTTAEVVTDFSNGPLVRTGGALDAAISGQGFFQVTDGNRQFLTRNGQFAIGQGSELVSAANGMRVVSTTGAPIVIPPEAERIQIGNDGTVSALSNDGTTVLGKLAVVQPASLKQLQKMGNSLFTTTGNVSPVGNDLELKQGFIEGSGVNPVSEMMDLIQSSRLVEANVNMIKYQDDSLDRLLQSTAGK